METNFYETFKNKNIVEQLGENDKIESFDCGDNDLNEFIINEASLFQKERLTVSYVLRSKEKRPEDVLAYFSLSNDKISISDFESKTKYNKFSKRFNNRKRLKSYPAVKIARLGVSKSLRGNNIGSFILKYLKTYFVLYNKTGCRFLTVDAYTDAMPFYQKNGFVPLNEDDAHDKTRLLYFDLNDVSG